MGQMATKITIVMLSLVALYLIVKNGDSVAALLETLASNMRRLTVQLQGRE